MCVLGLIFTTSLLSCGQEAASEPEVSVSVKNGCSDELESVYVQFGGNRTIGGALLPEKAATEGGIPFPVLLDEVEVRYRRGDQDFATNIPLRSLVPESIEGDFEVLFTVRCDGSSSVEITFWQYRHDGDRYRKVQLD